MTFKANDPLSLTYITGTIWQLASPLVYAIDETSEIVVPKGFITDMASIPQLLWNILPPQGGSWAQYGPAAVVHDYLYRFAVVWNSKANKYQPIDRAYADNVLYQAMTDLNNPLWVKLSIYYGVRCGGFLVWNKNRKFNCKVI